MFRHIITLSLLLFFISCAFALNATSTEDETSVKTIEDLIELTDVGEGRRRRRNRWPFGHHIWWWGLKALSVWLAVKIKLVLLVLFLGGGIFYALKVWNGTALGCPEPIIQEVKHHEHDYLPYHAHYDFTSPDIYSGYSGYSGYDSGTSIYSNTPPPSSYSAPVSSYGSPFTAPATASSSSDTSGPSNAYLPPNRRSSAKGRAIDPESSQMATDLMFRFLGVNTVECRRRFVCELEFRNPIVEHAMRYIGHDLFSEYRTAKESKAKKFTDCAILYPDCQIPKRSVIPVRHRKRNGVNMKRTETTTEQSDETTQIPDSVANYVQNAI